MQLRPEPRVFLEMPSCVILCSTLVCYKCLDHTKRKPIFKPALGLTVKRFPRAIVALYSIIAELWATKQSTITVETVPHVRIEMGNHATLFSWSELG